MKLARVALVVLIVTLSACGGGGGSGSGGGGPAQAQNASPGGIWTGTDSISGLKVTGIVDESGDFHFIREDGDQYVGTATVSGNTLSASFNGYTQGGIFGAGTLSGTIVARSSIQANTSFQPNGNTAESGTLNLTFSSLYDVASSISTIAGSYGDSSGDTATVYSDGTLFYQSASTGCSGDGVVTVPTPQYNVYQVSVTVQGCTGADAGLNGAAMTGLATYDNQASTPEVIVGVSSPGGQALVLTMTKN